MYVNSTLKLKKAPNLVKVYIYCAIMNKFIILLWVLSSH